MAARSFLHGWPIHMDETGAWLYDDTGERAGYGYEDRPCRRCGIIIPGSNEGLPDPCLGILPGVDNACCGHGVREQSYIRFTNGFVVQGFDIENWIWYANHEEPTYD